MPINKVFEGTSASSEKDRAHVSIIGGGVSGSGVVIKAVDTYERMLRDDPDIPDLSIDWFDSTNAFGVGVPYDLETFVFRLNQPATRMSIHSDRPGHFIEWLKQQDEAKNIREVAEARLTVKKFEETGLSESQIAYRYPDIHEKATSFGQSSFVPRALYKRYMQEELKHTHERAQAINDQLGREAVRIKSHVATVEDLKVSKKGKLTISAAEAEESDPSLIVHADAVALATGHHKNDLFGKFEGNPDYAATPLEDVDAIHRLVGHDVNPDKPLFIVGTSQSMLDALAALDAIGYKGKIIAASTRGIEPWPFDPEKHDRERIDYPLKHLTVDNIQKLTSEHQEDKAKVRTGLYKLFAQELQDPQAMELGVRNIITTILSEQSEICQEINKAFPGVSELCSQIAKEFDGNHTFPERYETYRHYKESGQLEIMRGRINVNVTEAIPREKGGGMKVHIESAEGEEPKTIDVAKMINCAAYARAPYRVDKETGYVRANDPVTQAAIDQGLVMIDPERRELQANPEAEALAEPVGPNRTAGWGVPYTKHSFENVARNVVDHAVSVTKTRLALLGPQHVIAAHRARTAPEAQGPVQNQA